MDERLQIALHSALAAGLDDDCAVAACRELPTEGDVPEWIEILPAGETIVGRDGRAFRNPNPQAVVNAYSAEDPVPVDYEHATEVLAPWGGQAPAAGWVKGLELRDGSTWAKIEWTPKGAAAVGGKEYRFVSPAFLHRDSEVQRIVSVGLTNRPNLKLKALNSRNTPKESTMDLAKILAALGLGKDATEEQVLTALHSIKSAQPTLDKFVPRADYDAALHRAQVAESEVKANKETARKAQVDAVIDGALKAGKITPATVDYHRAQCLRDGGIELFQKFVDAAPVVAPDQIVSGKPPKADAALNSEARDVAEVCGITPEQFALGAD